MIEQEPQINFINTAGVISVVVLLICTCLYLILVTEPEFDCTQKQISQIEEKALTCSEKDVEKCYKKLIEITCPVKRVR